jgi:hypothetical protein
MYATGGLEWERDSETLELQTDRVFFDIHRGFNEHPEPRGRDDVVPGRPGRYRRNRVDDRLVIELRGWVRGIGADAEERQQDFRDAVTALKAAMDPTGGAGTLTVIAPYLGLPAGSQSIEDAYPLNMLGGEVSNTMAFQRFSIELEVVGNPPRWGDPDIPEP